MYELSLFSGIGGSLLGSLLLGWRPIGYVEIDEYCQRVLAQRIRDGFLPPAPIFGDVHQFLLCGAAAQYRGFVDVVTADFPYQFLSTSTTRGGPHGPRNLWPATLECIRIVQPRFCFLANLPRLVTCGYLDRIIGDLTESGYDCRWRLLSAAELGAPYWRKRLWIVAHLDDTGCAGRRQLCSPGPSLGHHHQPHMGHAQSAPAQEQPGWWHVEPAVDRLVDGFPFGLERIRSAATARVPAVAATAWRLLMGEPRFAASAIVPPQR